MVLVKRIFFSVFVLIILFLLIMISILQLPQFGKTPKDKRLARIENSPNYKDGHFQNPVPTSMMLKDASYFTLIKLQFSDIKDKEPIKELKTLKRDLKAKTNEQAVVTWFGHSSFLLQIEGLNILVDPVFAERISPFSFIGSKRYPGTEIYSVDDLPPIDFVIISHDHYDHLDYSTILSLGKTKAKFVVPLGVGSHLEHWKISQDKITELDWWGVHGMGQGFEIVATPARHFSGRGLTDRDKTLWASYVLKTPNYKIFIGGDSGYGKHFEEIGEKYGPFNMAILENGQYYKYWPEIHMMPEETVKASMDLKAKFLLPVHWGKYSLSFHTWTEPITRLLSEAELQNVRVATPMIGQKVDLNNIPENNARWWLENDFK